MRVSLSYSPPSHEIEVDGNNVIMRFYENVEEVNEVDENSGAAFVGYRADRYTIRRPYDRALAGRVTTNVVAWREMAKREERETLAAKERLRRDKLLEASDKMMHIDTSLSPEQLEEHKAYRRALKNVPQQPGFPYDIDWPVEPS